MADGSAIRAASHLLAFGRRGRKRDNFLELFLGKVRETTGKIPKIPISVKIQKAVGVGAGVLGDM
jgi:hypothetical protein